MTAGGLVVGPTTDTFLSLNRYTAAGDDDDSTRPYVLLHACQTTTTDSTQFGIEAADRPKPLHLRLVRVGNKVSAYTGFDGKTWQDRGAKEVDWPDKIDVGVFVSHTSGKPVEGVFEDFRVTKPGK
jgi:regulation of enolase protein 1 (concanavalin A-like superfamily)